MLWFRQFSGLYPGVGDTVPLGWDKSYCHIGGSAVGRTRVTVDLDPDLRRRLRVAVASNDETIKDFIERAILRELEHEHNDGEEGELAEISA